LLGEVRMLGHAGDLDDPPQSHFTPAAAHLGPAQSRNQVTSFPLQLVVTLREAFDLCAQRGEGVATLVFQGANLRFGSFQRDTQGLDDLRDSGFTLAQRTRCHDLIAAHGFAGEAEEHLAVGAQRFPGQRVEGGLQAAFGLLQQRQPFGGLGVFSFAANAFAFERELQRVFFATGAQRGEDVTESGSESQRSDREREDEEGAQVPPVRSKCAR